MDEPKPKSASKVNLKQNVFRKKVNFKVVSSDMKKVQNCVT